MNYMLETIFTIINSLICGFFIIGWGYYLYDTKHLKIKWYNLIVFIIYSIIDFYSIRNCSNLLHIGTTIIGFIILHQSFFHKSLSTICSGTYAINLIRIIIILLEIIIGNFINLSIFENHYWLSSIFINILTTIIIFITHPILKNEIKKYDIYNKESWKSIIVICTIIITIFTLEISVETIYDNILILLPIGCILYLSLAIYQFKCQKVTLDTYLANYYEIFKFSKFMESLIDNYKNELYSTKNQLTVVKEMIKKKNKDKNMITYLDDLIEEKSHIDYSWLSCLSDLNITGIKGFLSYKIEEMKDLNIEVELFISDSLNNTNINLTHDNLKKLCVIIGIFCDNAKEAAMNSKNKTITIQSYSEKDNIHILIANTYDKLISLKNIDEFGVTSHKKGCGCGLYLVHTIIENSNIFNKKTSIIDDFFVQELTIKITNG